MNATPRHRHRYTLPAAILSALALGGCSWKTLGVPDYPLGVPEQHRSLKDEPIKPVSKPIAPTAFVLPSGTYKGITSRILVVNPDQTPNDAIAMQMFHALNLRGYINKDGNWRIVGAVEGNSVRWRIIDHTNKAVADIDQAGTSDAATQAIVPGVISYLPLSL